MRRDSRAEIANPVAHAAPALTESTRRPDLSDPHPFLACAPANSAERLRRTAPSARRDRIPGERSSWRARSGDAYGDVSMRAATTAAPSLRDERDGRRSYDRAIVLRGTRSRGLSASASDSYQAMRLGRLSPIRADAQARRSARPSGPPCPRGPDRDRQAVASRPRSRSRRRSPEMGDVAPRGTNRRGERSALASQFPQHAANGVPGARGHLTAARTKERFSPHW